MIENFIEDFVLTDGDREYLISAASTLVPAKIYRRGESYDLAVHRQPAGARCEIDPAAGVIDDDLQISVRCGYLMSGRVSGEDPAGLLISNGTENLAINATGDFKFSKILVAGSPYSVTILRQPVSGIPCHNVAVEGIMTEDFTDVFISCNRPFHNVIIETDYPVGRAWVEYSFYPETPERAGGHCRITSYTAGTGVMFFIPPVQPTRIRYFFMSNTGFTCRIYIGDDTTSEHNSGTFGLRTDADTIRPDGIAGTAPYVLNVFHKMEYRNINWITRTAEIYLNQQFMGKISFANSPATSFTKTYVMNDSPTECNVSDILIE